MRKFTNLLIIVLILSSCGKKQPGTNDNNQDQSGTLTMNTIAADTSKILIAELPVYFDSTDYIIHPIGLISLDAREKRWDLKMSSLSKSDYSGSGFEVNSYREDYFSGNVANLVFENLNTRNQTLLTEKFLNITHVQYLRDLSKKINRHYILYSVIDKDMNHDGKYDYNDISSLYISRVDGTDFRKITKNFHHYNGGKLILQDLKYYFITIEDIDKDGNFTKADALHYYYIDFAKSDYKITEYDPLKLITK